jgi:hypothetical protein
MKLHHFRGKLYKGDKLCLDPANVYIDYHATGADPASGWSGYLLVKSDKDVVPGGIYTLKLEDGRAGKWPASPPPTCCPREAGAMNMIASLSQYRNIRCPSPRLSPRPFIGNRSSRS